MTIVFWWLGPSQDQELQLYRIITREHLHQCIRHWRLAYHGNILCCIGMAYSSIFIVKQAEAATSKDIDAGSGLQPIQSVCNAMEQAFQVFSC